MKPLILEMTAFGSYAKKTVIDFRDFRSGLYLVTGDTGAGKTTIFDGIMIALFGEASGKTDTKGNDNNRSFEKLHSDFVGKDVPSFVKLAFSQDGKEYTVERTLRYPKKRGSENTYGNATTDAVLYEPDKNPIKNDTKVNKRIIEIIGMDGEKFRRVVMLAQGEFKKFLQADSDTKGKILGDLFDSSMYLYYQNLLNEAKRRLGEQRKGYVQDIVSAMEHFDNPDPANEDFLPGSAKLQAALEKLVEEDQAKAEELGKLFEAAEAKYTGIIRMITAAEQDNRDLEELVKAKKKAVELADCKAEMELLEKQKERVKDAFYKVVPKKKEQDDCKKTLSDLQEAVEKLNRQIETAEAEVEEKDLICKEDRMKKDEVISLGASIKSIEESLPDYRKLAEAKNAQGIAAEKLAAATKKRKAVQAEEDALKKRMESLEAEEGKYSGADVELAEASQKVADAKKKLNVLTDKKSGVLSDHKKIKEHEKQLEKDRKTALGLLGKQQNAFAVYSGLNTLFMEGQAGILAEKLGMELAEKAEANCPVCGTHLKREDLGKLAGKKEDTPSEDEVKTANEAYEQARKACDDKNGEISAEESNLLTVKKHVVEKLSEYCPTCTDWETLDAPSFLADLQTVWKAEVKSAEEKEAAAKTRKAEADQLKNDLKAARENLGKKTAAVKDWDEKIAKEKEIYTQTTATIETLEPKLSYKNEVEAKQQKSLLEGKKKAHEDSIQEHEDALRKIREKLAGYKGSLEENQKKLPDAEAALAGATEALAEVLSACAFADLEAAEELLDTSEKEAATTEKWIIGKEKDLNDYRTDCSLNAQKVKDLGEKTAGKEMADLEALEESRRLAKEDKDRCDSEKTDHHTKADNHAKTRDCVLRAKASLAGTDTAWKRIDRLASLAVASENAEGGRLSFERYVMGSVFVEILEMANMRLDMMTGGKYKLVHRNAGSRKNGIAGFQINVYDQSTDKERPSETLSGGESFMASLALALGLSDVVQNHEGGIQIDSLFIDEGFGTLDDGVLDKAVEVLKQLTEGDRLVGIISHVGKLESSIPDKIVVKAGENGSRVEIRH